MLIGMALYGRALYAWPYMAGPLQYNDRLKNGMMWSSNRLVLLVANSAS